MIGLAASKKWQESIPVKFLIFFARFSEVNGPVARTVTVSPVGISNCSIFFISIRG